MQKLIFYTAMLTILVLPVLMVGPLLSNKGTKERCLSVVFPDRPSCGRPNPHPVYRTYREFALTEDADCNVSEFKRIRKELRDIRKTNDKHRGIRIRISNHASFQDYITSLDICKEEGQGTFVPLSNDVWVPEIADFEEPLVLFTEFPIE
jgi:hypothetical protein